MAEASKGMDGAEKAAIFLMVIGEASAAEVMKHLGPREVQKIGVAMSGLEVVSPSNVKTSVDEFIQSVREHTGIGIGNEDFIRNVLTNALGEDKATSMIDRILLGGNTKGLEALKWMDARAIVELIRFEHPQIIAIVLSFLDSDQSAEVLSLLPENTRADLLMRIATMEGIQPAAMKELNEMLEQQLRGGAGGQQSSMGGIKCAAEILNFIDRSVEAKISERITELDADLAERIQDLMFTFENLVDIDDRGVQALLREVSTDNLVLALKGTDEAIKDKIFNNMSQRAAEMLRDDLDAKGPVKLSEVEGAQKEILTIARRLADEGTISLGGGGGGEQMI
ncbi:MAG: flagellar motor switch protein FliG [Gammaproteobacteria bacterium]|nr:flagellar motor switch protein FliG [Gammaproteobacteria bacterium]MCP5202292.1 flagellar motor switch protein FliG [Gammaproteobacteria bacterium]